MSPSAMGTQVTVLTSITDLTLLKSKMCNMQGDAQGKIFRAISISNRAQAMHAGATTFMRLSSQNETVNK